MLLMPSRWKSASSADNGARSRPRGMPEESWPAWWFAGSAALPLPDHEPWAPSQLADFRRKRCPWASTTYRPRVDRGGCQVAAAAAAAVVAGAPAGAAAGVAASAVGAGV